MFEKIQEKIKRYYQIEEAIIVSNAKVKIHTQVGTLRLQERFLSGTG